MKELMLILFFVGVLAVNFLCIKIYLTDFFYKKGSGFLNIFLAFLHLLSIVFLIVTFPENR